MSLSSSSDDESSLFESLETSLESDPSLAPYRAQRLQQLHAELSRAKDIRAKSHGTYIEIKDEKALMDIVTGRTSTGTRWCVVHFFKPDFRRCGVMDGHLEILSKHHIETRFLRINVENAPFLVTKLHVRVLPCVISFVDGVSVDRIVGFEGLGRGSGRGTGRSGGSGRDTGGTGGVGRGTRVLEGGIAADDDDDNTFSTQSLESRLILAGVLEGEKDIFLSSGSRSGTAGTGEDRLRRKKGKTTNHGMKEAEDDDDEWD